MAVQYSDTIFASMASQDAASPTTTVVLVPDKSIYKDTSALNVGPGEVISFELIVSMGPTVQEVDFPEGVAWYDDIAPVMSAPSKDYTYQFRSFDGGDNLVCGNQVSENNGRR